MSNNLPVFTSISNVQLDEAKKNNTWPLASVTVLESVDKNQNDRFYYTEIVSNPEAGWITLGDPQHYVDYIDNNGVARRGISKTDLESLKHAAWAATEVFFQKKNAVMEPGCHILDVDLSKSPESEIGMIAAWCSNPRFANFAPAEGWACIKVRVIGGGAIHYVAGGYPADGRETKHDYMDMMLNGTANFRLFLACDGGFLNYRRLNEGGEYGSSWAETWTSSFEGTREESIAASAQAVRKYVINNNAFQSVKTELAQGYVADPTVVVDMDGNALELASVELGTRLHVYATFGKDVTYIRSIKWDGSDMSKNLIAKFKQYRFATELVAVEA